MKRPYCPPNTRPLTPAGPCLPLGRPSTTPLGGPASGLWPSGSGGGSQPLPTCLQATIFRDCFLSCAGTIDDANLGPVCGWTFNQTFGPSGGSIVLSPNQALFVTDDDFDFPGMTKGNPTPKLNWNNTSFQINFREFPTPANEFTIYQFFFKSVDASQSVTLSLFGDGTVIAQVGPPAAISNYFGTWSPLPGADRSVYLTVDANGVPRLFISFVEIPLVFSGTGVSPGILLPPNTMTAFFSSGDLTPTQAPLSSLFVTNGNPGPGTEFCCQ